MKETFITVEARAKPLITIPLFRKYMRYRSTMTDHFDQSILKQKSLNVK